MIPASFPGSRGDGLRPLECLRLRVQDLLGHLDGRIRMICSQALNHGDPDASHKRMEVIADIEYLEIDEAVLDLPRKRLGGGDFPQKSVTDSAHIAVAARHGMDCLFTWSCKHI